jgi:glycosyltransferase involved in cell wall biosynthesis
MSWEILFVGYGDWYLWRWDGFRTRSAQLCRFLSRSDRCRALCVVNEPVYLRRLQPGFAVPRMDRFRALPLRGGLRQAEAKVRLLDPSRFLAGPDGLKRRYTARLIRKSLPTPTCPSILWIANVHKAHLMEKTPASIKVFDAIDDWESVTVFRHLGRRIRAGYETVLEHADIIFTVSRHLEEKFRAGAKTSRIVHLPNGVDAGLFRLPADPPSLRRESRRDGPPVLTYVGVLSERVDFDLLERAARQWPRCRVRLVGPVSRIAEPRLRALRQIPNLDWTGLVHHGGIPGILQGSDVLLIPHRESPLTRSMDPLKLYEYLTTGLPIVSTPVPPTEEYPSLLYVASGETFSERIGEALEEVHRADAEARWRARIEESRRHHWDRRVARIEEEIAERLGAGTGPDRLSAAACPQGKAL